MSEKEQAGNSWSEWRIYVVEELREIKEQISKLHDLERKNKLELAVIKERIAIRSGVFGAIGAALVVGITLLIQFIKR